MKKKIHKDSTGEGSQTNLQTDGYRVVGTREIFHLTPIQIMAKGPKMIEWLKKNTEATCIEEWLEFAEIADSTWYQWLTHYPTLREDQDDALRLLANRRERGIYYKKLNMNDHQLAWIHGRYRKYWREEEALKAARKAEDSQKPTTINLNMGNFDAKKP